MEQKGVCEGPLGVAETGLTGASYFSRWDCSVLVALLSHSSWKGAFRGLGWRTGPHSWHRLSCPCTAFKRIDGMQAGEGQAGDPYSLCLCFISCLLGLSGDSSEGDREGSLM